MVKKKDTVTKPLEIHKNHLTKIILQYGKYKGKERLDIRQWVAIDGPDGEADKWIPTKSGVSIPKDLVPEFKKLILRV